MEKNNRISAIVETALENLESLIDVNAVVGKPINTDDGNLVIPVSKVTFGYLAGGGEYGKLTLLKKSDDLPFSAGNGAIVSVKPCAFFIKTKDGEYKSISVSSDGYERIIDKAMDFLGKISDEK